MKFAVCIVALVTLVVACAKPAGTTYSVRGSSVKILMLGDSVTWGQGLGSGEKIKDYVAKAFEDAGAVVPSPDIVAHSGAVIGARDSGTHTPELHGEVPSKFPSILEQVDEAANGGPYDVIIVAACINDLTVANTLAPIPDNLPSLDKLVKRYCHDDELTLLNQIRTRLVTPGRTRVIVLSYFPVLSTQSNERLPKVSQVAVALMHEWTGSSTSQLQKILALHEFVKACPFLAIYCHAEAHAVEFWQQADKNISAAVAEIHDPAIEFVSPSIGEDHSAYASVNKIASSWLWEVKTNHFGGFMAIDHAQRDRIPYCGKNKTCIIASIGHPNVCGEVQYADAIIDKLGLTSKPAMPANCW